MDHQSNSETTATPPATPSRATTVLHSLRDCGSPAADAAIDSVEPCDEFNPYQLLMHTSLKVEFGPKLALHRMIHQEILCCHSTVFAQWCKDAKTHRYNFEQLTSLKTQLAPFVFPEVTEQQFKEKGMQDAAMLALRNIYNEHPVAEQKNKLRLSMDKAISDQFACKNTIPDPNQKQNTRKDSRDVSPGVDIATRIGYLNAAGTFGVTTEMYSRVHRFIKGVQSSAKTNPVLATAQGRLLLLNHDETAIDALVEWIYNATVSSQTTVQTYATLGLAMQLDVAALAEKCLEKLTDGFNYAVFRACCDGVPLFHLLDPTGQVDDIVKILVNSISRGDNTHQRLVELVMETLADHLDAALWKHFRALASPQRTLQLMDTVVKRRLIKPERHSARSPRSENDDVVTGSSMVITHTALE
ncbi:hypothetical protein ACN47E_007431 [Coniothyrium glycines]